MGEEVHNILAGGGHYYNRQVMTTSLIIPHMHEQLRVPT